MEGISKWTNFKEKGLTYIKMEIYIKVISFKIIKMDKEFTIIINISVFIKGIGKIIKNKVLVN